MAIQEKQNDSNVLDSGVKILISDSDELSKQYDSRRLDWDELVKIAQEHLFTNRLDIMRNYLTTSQFKAYKSMIEGQISKMGELLDELSRRQPNTLLKAVPGQVILVHADTLRSLNVSPLEYIQRFWVIPNGYSAQQIKGGCFLKGVSTTVSSEIKNQSSGQVTLASPNFPQHMHHPGITSNSSLQCIGSSSSASENIGQSDGTMYDMFNSDGAATGFDDNEINGVVEKFSPNFTGQDSPQHNNIPFSTEFYAFSIERKTS